MSIPGGKGGGEETAMTGVSIGGVLTTVGHRMAYLFCQFSLLYFLVTDSTIKPQSSLLFAVIPSNSHDSWKDRNSLVDSQTLNPWTTGIERI